MEPQPNSPPLIVITGQTASGKSALALELAERFNGEIIAADSRTVYKGMDIGTAKPGRADQRRVPHHLLDVIEPDEVFTVADFKRLARACITEIAERGKVPFLVGGAGLYIDAVLFDFSFRGTSDPARRRELEELTVEELQAELTTRGIPLPSNARNPRHLIRAIETEGKPSGRSELRPNTLVLGMSIEHEVLQQRVAARVASMFRHGLPDEVRHLYKRYGAECRGLQSIGYQEFLPYLAGEMPIDSVRRAVLTHTMQYAKRQRAWFKRNQHTHWISKTEDAVDLLTTFLNN